MLFGWLRERRRRKLLAQPFPQEWLSFLEDVPHYQHLSAPEQARLRDDLRIFIAEKNWEGCRGLKVTDRMKVTIAAQACLLVLAIPNNHFAEVCSILIYPRAYQVPGGHYLGGGFTLERPDPVLGNTQYRGPVLLSWADVRDVRGGHNLVLHEFAHQLDFLNGWIDGTPPLGSKEQYEQWREVMTAEFERLRKESAEGQPTLLDPYGATNEAEFFAVATECFFEQPVEMARRHARLYELLRDYYHQDPAARVRGERLESGEARQ